MKRIAYRLIAVVLALAVAGSAFLAAAAQDNAFDREIAYYFNGVRYVCAASAVPDAEALEEGKGERYCITFALGSVAEPIQARLSRSGISFDNSQPGADHVYRQEIWSVFAKYCMALYRSAFDQDMVGRSVNGAARELHMHYWMFRFGAALRQMVAPLDQLLGKVPQLSNLFGMLDTLYNRALVTELGPTDGSDHNGYIFEQANSDLQCLFLYGRDFLSLDFADGLIDYTNRMQPYALARTDQILFHPNDMEFFAEVHYVKTL